MTPIDRLAQLRGNITKADPACIGNEELCTGSAEDTITPAAFSASSIAAKMSLPVQSPHLRNSNDAVQKQRNDGKPRRKSFLAAVAARCSFRKTDRQHSSELPGQSVKTEQTGNENQERTPLAVNGRQEVAPRQIPGWVSPNYTSSREVQLSPSVVLANRGIIFEAESATVDAYKMLRTQILQRLQQTNGRTVMITSAVPGEGKTVTAINLAFTFAKEFQQTVLLVDCDLQQQRIHQYLGYESDKGLINYLLDDCPVNELFTWPGIEKITLVSGGRTFNESSEILGAPRMRELIDNMKFRYPERYVFFDVPSIQSGADALVFAPMVDHVLLVVEEGKTSINDIKKSIAMLPEGKLLGLILNRHRQDR